MIQKLSAHIKLHIGCALFTFNVQENAHSFLHSFFYIIQNQSSHFFLPQTRSLYASLAQTSIESETALHAFKHCLTFQPRHLSQEGRSQPSVCIMVVHNFCHMPRSGLIERRLDVQACQNTLLILGHCRVSAWDSVSPAIPSVFVVSSSSSLLFAGS